VKRTLDDRDVAERRQQLFGDQFSFEALAVRRQHQEGQVGPRFLLLEHLGKRSQRRIQCFERDDREAGATRDLVREVVDRLARERRVARFLENQGRDVRIATERREDQRALRQRPAAGHASFPARSAATGL